MRKIKTLLKYEVFTAVKALGIFYAIELIVIFLIMIILSSSSIENGRTTLEMNSIMFLGFLCVLGFTVDFKMLVQNGFTRKSIYFAAFGLFLCFSLIIALVDTSIMRMFSSFISSNYLLIYNDLGVFGQIVFAFLVNFLICSLLYTIAIINNMLGSKLSLITFSAVGALLIVSVVLIVTQVDRVLLLNFLKTIAGFKDNGTVNYFIPVGFIIGVSGVFSLLSYKLLKRTELKV